MLRRINRLLLVAWLFNRLLYWLHHWLFTRLFNGLLYGLFNRLLTWLFNGLLNGLHYWLLAELLYWLFNRLLSGLFDWRLNWRLNPFIIVIVTIFGQFIVIRVLQVKLCLVNADPFVSRNIFVCLGSGFSAYWQIATHNIKKSLNHLYAPSTLTLCILRFI